MCESVMSHPCYPHGDDELLASIQNSWYTRAAQGWIFIARRSTYPPNRISTHCEQELTTATSRNSTSTAEAVPLSTEAISLTRENSNT